MCIIKLMNPGAQLVGSAHLAAGGNGMIPDIFKLLESSGIRTEGNPDIYLREYQNFGIDEARELRDRASLRAIAGGQRVFIVTAASMTAEAQNALLKTLEEPAAEALFFLLVPSPDTLLSTLRSRMQRLPVSLLRKKEDVIDADEFLDAHPQERIAMLKPLLEKDEDESRDMGAIVNFLSDLERATASRKSRKEGLPAQAGLHAVYRARKYIMDKGALSKPLLEQVALLI